VNSVAQGPATGADLPETVLDFDSARRAVLLGAEKSTADSRRVAEGILDYLRGISGRAKEAEINEAVEGSTKLQRAALRELFEAGKVLREGSGRKGDPYLQLFRKMLVFLFSGYIGNKKTRIGKHSLSC